MNTKTDQEPFSTRRGSAKRQLELPSPSASSRLRHAATLLESTRAQVALSITEVGGQQLGKEASAIKFIMGALEAIQRRVSQNDQDHA